MGNALCVCWSGVRYSIAPGESLVVGRSHSCSIVIRDSAVSRRHAAIKATPEGLTVEDLNSHNGTAVNGKPIEGAKKLTAGDSILVGHAVLDVKVYDVTESSAREDDFNPESMTDETSTLSATARAKIIQLAEARRRAKGKNS